MQMNYRGVSNLHIFSKIIEKSVADQLCPLLESLNIFDTFQSGFRRLHSTETALVKVTNDILMAADDGKCTVSTLLDLSSAFDTVDHDILFDRLKFYGITGSALEFFKSYLTGRSFSVALGGFTSDTAPLKYGVPQGSVLGPLLFAIYMFPLG